MELEFVMTGPCVELAVGVIPRNFLLKLIDLCKSREIDMVKHCVSRLIYNQDSRVAEVGELLSVPWTTWRDNSSVASYTSPLASSYIAKVGIDGAEKVVVDKKLIVSDSDAFDLEFVEMNEHDLILITGAKKKGNITYSVSGVSEPFDPKKLTLYVDELEYYDNAQLVSSISYDGEMLERSRADIELVEYIDPQLISSKGSVFYLQDVIGRYLNLSN